jgi:hypothetical protein
MRRERNTRGHCERTIGVIGPRRVDGVAHAAADEERTGPKVLSVLRLRIRRDAEREHVDDLRVIQAVAKPDHDPHEFLRLAAGEGDGDAVAGPDGFERLGASDDLVDAKITPLVGRCLSL